MAFIPGTKKYDSTSATNILDLSNGLDYLRGNLDGIALLKRLGTNKFTARSVKHEWTEVELASRSEEVTVLIGDTDWTVADAYQYQVNDLIRCESEIVRVTALKNATEITVTRAYAGTVAAAHAAKTAFSLGSADPENSAAPAGIQDSGARLYNYVQTLTRGVSLSNDEILQLSTEGNPLNGQLERRFIELNRLLAKSVFYGVRYEDTTNNIHVMGGLKQFITTNVTNVGGALTIAAIDAKILAIVNAGGDPKMIVLSPYQKQKLDALDASKQMLGKSEHVGGNLVTQTWQSGVLGHSLDIVVDQTILTDELWILDDDNLEIGPAANNGVNGAFHVEDATTPGTDGENRVIRGKYTMRVKQQKAHAYLYGLS